MVRKLIGWALDNPLVVILLSIFLAIVGVHSFLNVNVEAYPDPAPAIVEVIALYPGASAADGLAPVNNSHKVSANEYSSLRPSRLHGSRPFAGSMASSCSGDM